ncbi:MAG TPA: restriction endonuclease subunit S [Planctomycetota bacterium]|jgi:type I restriction enzyme S subunit|nr:restriction endonuclease subunit S [Planctomycetota bacterium]
MAGEWRECALGDVIELKRGYDLPQQNRRLGAVPLVSSSGVTDYHAEAMAKGPGVVTGRYGTLGQVFYIDKDFWPLNTTLYVRDFKGNDPRFVSYFLRGLDFLAYSDKAAVPGLNRNHLHQARVSVPTDPNEQRAIAHILGTLDDKIELNRRMNETLEAMARALFKSWFVDFDPVPAKAEGRDSGLPKPLADLFPARLVDSELGEIPEGWGEGHFGDVVEQLRDQENPLSSPDVLYHHFSIPAFDEGQSSKPEYGEGIKSLKSRVPAGVILLSKLNPEIERVWLVDVRPGGRAVCSTEFLVLRARTPFTRSYVYCLARSPLFRQQIEGLVTGTSKSHQRAPVDSILNLAVVTPPSSIVAAFDRSADSLLARTLECRSESRTLAVLRDTLLPKLISGELRLKDADRLLAEAR